MFYHTECLTLLDLAFIVDASGSIIETDSEGWNRVKNFLVQVVNSVTVGRDQVRVGLVTYSNSASRNSDQGAWNLLRYSDRDNLIAAINNIPYIGGTTNTQDGLNYARTQIFVPSGDRPGVTNLAIVITDGVSNVETASLPREAQALRDNALVIAVGVTNAVNEDELNLIASEDSRGRNYVLRVTDFRQLASQIDNLLDETCIAVTLPPPTSIPGKVFAARLEKQRYKTQAFSFCIMRGLIAN